MSIYIVTNLKIRLDSYGTERIEPTGKERAQPTFRVGRVDTKPSTSSSTSLGFRPLAASVARRAPSVSIFAALLSRSWGRRPAYEDPEAPKFRRVIRGDSKSTRDRCVQPLAGTRGTPAWTKRGLDPALAGTIQH